MEKYIILNWGEHIVFKDSLQFMNCSLEKLVANLLKSGRANLQVLLSHYSGAQADLLLRKGVYPYDYMNKWKKFDEHQLPSRESFYNRLRDEPCSEADYEHAQKISGANSTAAISESTTISISKSMYSNSLMSGRAILRYVKPTTISIQLTT